MELVADQNTVIHYVAVERKSIPFMIARSGTELARRTVVFVYAHKMKDSSKAKSDGRVSCTVWTRATVRLSGVDTRHFMLSVD